MPTFVLLKIINELLFDDNNVSDNEKRKLEDNFVNKDIIVSSGSDKDCEVNFGTPNIEM
ncbi:2689_t:CDS:1, partial [Funneliformis mosseae]